MLAGRATRPRRPRPRPCFRRLTVVGVGVSVDDLAPRPGLWESESVVVVGDGREVGHARHLPAIAAGAQEREHVVGAVVGVDPAEARGVLILRPQCRGIAIATVQVTDEVVHTAMLDVIQEPPVELASLGPLGLLGELDAHEDQLLAGVRPHEGEVGPQVGELAPPVAGHLAQQRTLAVHHFVVGQGEYVVLGVRVHHRERHLVMVVLPMHRVVGHVAERVVHPAHVPLEAETQAADVGRPGDTRPGRRLLGDRDDTGSALVAGGVDLLQERDRLEVLASAVDVGRPLALFARVVEIEHRGHGIDPEPVDVEDLQPVDGVGDEEVADLPTAEVEDVGAPLRMLAAGRVGMLVQRRPVETGQRPVVLGEVRWHPVHDHADAGLMQSVDQQLEPVRIAEPRGRREVRRDLIAPRTAERMLGDRAAVRRE